MKRLNLFVFIVLGIVCIVSCRNNNTTNKQTSIKKLIDDDLRLAVRQYKILMTSVPGDSMPRTFENGRHVNSKITWWCSGFYPGTLWYLFEASGDTVIRNEAVRCLTVLAPVQYYTGNHDLGFMMYSSFGNAYRITGNDVYKPVLINAAKSLAIRYRPNIGVIQSWNTSQRYECPVIIDNMMNLELLEWAGKNSQDTIFSYIARNHADNTLKNHFRPDYSSYHVVDYDTITGNVIKKATHQGFSDSSSWSRGQAWGLYGYTMMYRMTGNKKYLKQARNIACFILDNPDMPEDMIPYWDFNAPGIPDEERDASAGAVIASGLLELGRYTSGEEKERYVGAAEKILRSLSSPVYRSKLGENGGYILMHSVGSKPHNSEVDVPLTYADYYFIEALLRYKNWYL